MSEPPIPYHERPPEWGFPKWREYLRIVASFEFYDLPNWARDDILNCLHDDWSWDWFKDSDGCTSVSEPGWPSKYFPPCVRHDYDWQIGQGGWESNARFRMMNKLYCMEPWRANIRWFGVTASWYSWVKWQQMVCRSLSI